MFFLQNLFYCIVISELFPPIQSRSEESGLFFPCSHFGHKDLYLFQLLLILNLECVLGLKYPFPTPTSR